MTVDVERGQITDRAIELMRMRIGYPNPTVRAGIWTRPWNTVTTEDAIRHWVEGSGGDNPLYVDPAYGPATRWRAQIAPPLFERTVSTNRVLQRLPDDVERESRHALRAVQLYHSGSDHTWYRPLFVGDACESTNVVDDVQEKQSSFAGRSVIVTNKGTCWNLRGDVVSIGRHWFVHAERRSRDADAAGDQKRQRDEPARYSDDDLARIERAYDEQFLRGADTWYYEDIEVGAQLPPMVKGPLTITDMINMHMGGGWFGYGAPPLRLAHENRKKLRGFYVKDEFGSWDVVQRVHWDRDLARQVGVPMLYDIGPMREAWVTHYATNLMGDDAWLFRQRVEFRRFNYFGDTTWLNAVVTSKSVSPELGPSVDLEITGTNQRGQVNVQGVVTILVSSREHGPVTLPVAPTIPAPGPLRQGSGS